MGIRKDIHFNDPTINNLVFKKNESFNIDDFNGLENITYDLKVLDKTNENENNYEENENNYEEYENSSLVIFTLKVGGETTNFPFYIEIEYQSVFEWDNDCGIDKDTIVGVNAPAILYSYCRPIISSITGFSEFPPLNIPFYNFTNKKTINKPHS